MSYQGFATTCSQSLITSERGKQFLKIFEEDTGRSEPDAFTAVATDAYLILVDSIERPCSTDPEKISEAILTTMDFDGVSGKITMKADGDPIKAMVIDKVENGKFVYVTTIEP